MICGLFLDEILAALTLDEKVALTHGQDLWSTDIEPKSEKWSGGRSLIGG